MEQSVSAPHTRRFQTPLPAPIRPAHAAAKTEDAMIQGARTGDQAAFCALIRAHHGAAERVARHIMRTDEAAADALQDSFIKVYRAMPRFQDGNFRSWLLRIVTNTCYDHLRRQRRRPALSLDELLEQPTTEFSTARTLDGPPLSDNPEQITVHRETMQRILAAIADLPSWHRNVVLLVDVHGCDYAEAADTLDLPLGTVKSRLSRGRAALRNRLVEENLIPARLQ